MPTEPTLEEAARRAVELVSRCKLLGPDELDAREAIDILYAALAHHAETMEAVRELAKTAAHFCDKSMPEEFKPFRDGMLRHLYRLRALGALK